ncbi:nicotinate phosphoribosyltransferase [Corallococcus caeni]|uniref:nicotinate phosphoribosyltransferase n=1 Tax=Corallococcus caeni TaxID=3082388 RepID=UPI0029576422|nr:nicotinate phosphoribosyltransferase [Corallococcus sp. KH5-1]
MAPALLTDLYELTMVDAYLAEGLNEEAAFSLFVRRLPARRNFLLACGLEQALTYLETLRFSPADLSWLESLGRFSRQLLDWLEHFRFTGDVHAVPEGTPVFGQEPLLEVVGPLPEAQLVETYLINQVHLQTLAASKAARVVEAARGRPVVDFGVRRMHGEDAGLKVVRAEHVAGVSATSNLQAAQRYGIPVAGTLAHSYIQAHDDELAAFRAYVHRFPETTLLVDTYDTLEGVRKVVALANELGSDFHVRAVRLDSGDLLSLSQQTRALLDAAGLERVRILASGGLDEDEVAQLLAHQAPIDAFGVGTAMGVSDDAPALDMAYKLVEYAGRGRLKLSSGKVLLPGRKQVFREEQDGVARRDVLACHDEALPGHPLLRRVMDDGRRLEGASPPLAVLQAHAREALARLPLEVRRLEPARPPYPVEVSAALSAAKEQVVAGLRERLAVSRAHP